MAFNPITPLLRSPMFTFNAISESWWVPRMAAVKRYRLIRPECRFCLREWTPPSYVSANISYCSECEADRLKLALKRSSGVRLVTGLNGENRLVPANQ
jgi:hypothetical protein